MDAIIFLVVLVGLAVAAPRWGYDSTDGVDSAEYGRLAAWLGAGRRFDPGAGAGRGERVAADRSTPAEAVASGLGACRPALAGAETA